MNHYEKMYFSIFNSDEEVNLKTSLLALCDFFIYEKENPFFIDTLDFQKLIEFYKSTQNHYLLIFFNSLKYFNTYNLEENTSSSQEFLYIKFKLQKFKEKCQIKNKILNNPILKDYIYFLKSHNVDINLKNLILFLDHKKIKSICFTNEKAPHFNIRKEQIIYT